jgi:hypothetical protein
MKNGRHEGAEKALCFRTQKKSDGKPTNRDVEDSTQDTVENRHRSPIVTGCGWRIANQTAASKPHPLKVLALDRADQALNERIGDRCVAHS